MIPNFSCLSCKSKKVECDANCERSTSFRTALLGLHLNDAIFDVFCTNKRTREDNDGVGREREGLRMWNSDKTEQYALEFETESCSYSRLPVDSRRYLEPIFLRLQREREKKRKRRKKGKWKEGVILTESIVIARFLYLPKYVYTPMAESF